MAIRFRHAACCRRRRSLFILILTICCIVSVKFLLRSVDGKSDLVTKISKELMWKKGRHGNQSTSFSDQQDKNTIVLQQQSCVHPKLQLDNPAIRSYVKNVTPIVCSGEPDWVYTNHGRFFISSDAEKRHGKITCTYLPIIPAVNDTFTVWKAVSPVKNGSLLTADAFKVACKSADGKNYVNIQPCIARRASPPGKPNPNTMPLNVFMLGIDSLSRHMWMRLLPKSHKYFTEIMGGQILEGYNIVGDGTPQALMPLLTGHSEAEIPEIRRGKPGALPIDDVLNFVWKRFEKLGYTTQWGEDMSHIGTFNLRMLGFRHQPVVHYMRPYFMSASSVYKYFKNYCMASKPRHKVFLDWFKEGLITNRDKRFFTFSFYAELSHTDNNNIQLVDNDFLEFLQFLMNSKILKDTLLIVMSDHGARFNSIRTTEQGKLEERMPYFGFRFPTWFPDVFPQEMKNFKKNRDRLVTPFDIHETFLDIINHTKPEVGSVKQRAISLFHEIPLERTCSDAHIEPHFCACLDWKYISTRNADVTKGVNLVLQLINNITSTVASLCLRLDLDSITNATTYSTREAVLKFKQSVDADGRIPDLSDNTEKEVVLFQVTFILQPGQGHFEATFKKNAIDGQFYVNSNEISRINKYGDQPHCISSSFPHLRPYCVCKRSL